MFPKARFKHLSPARSNHTPILLDTYMEDSNLPCPFRFEAMWIKEEESKKVVYDA